MFSWLRIVIPCLAATWWSACADTGPKSSPSPVAECGAACQAAEGGRRTAPVRGSTGDAPDSDEAEMARPSSNRPLAAPPTAGSTSGTAGLGGIAASGGVAGIPQSSFGGAGAAAVGGGFPGGIGGFGAVPDFEQR